MQDADICSCEEEITDECICKSKVHNTISVMDLRGCNFTLIKVVADALKVSGLLFFF